MTRQDFLTNFYLQYDKISTLGAPGYQPQEIALIATEAQETLIKTRYSAMSNSKQEGFEETEKRAQDLGNLVTELTPFTPDPISVGNVKNGRFFTMPNTQLANPTDYSNVFWFPIYEECVTDRLDCSIPNNTTVYDINYIVRMQHQQWANEKYNPFQRPSKDRVVRLNVDSRRVELVTDGTYNITTYNVRYIKKPQPIDLTNNLTQQVSQLADHMHRELLEETIRIAYKDTDQLNKLQAEKREIIE